MVTTSVKNLVRKGYYQSLKLLFPEFVKIQTEANGMLHPLVYKKMYDLVCELPDLNIVEIGGASGAGSVAIASALKDSKKKAKLIVVEKCEGGSRVKFGDYHDNLSVISKNFERFGVHDNIILFLHAITFENGADADVRDPLHIEGLIDPCLLPNQGSGRFNGIQ